LTLTLPPEPRLGVHLAVCAYGAHGLKHLSNHQTVLTFFSNALSDNIEFRKLSELSDAELADFNAELSTVVEALDKAVADAKATARSTGVPVDSDWLHRVGTKKRIALKFSAEILSLRQGGTTTAQKAEYERIYKALYRAMLLEEFGEVELKEFEQEVLDKARAAYQTWIESTGQRTWYAP